MATARKSSAVSAVVVGASLASLALVKDAEACGACGIPQLWGVETLAGEPVVVTNFGLLHQVDGAWSLTCEEVIGGLMFGALGNAQETIVSTDSGLFRTAGDLCHWDPAPPSATNDWALSIALPEVADAGVPSLFALRVDRATQELRVERSDSGGDFVVVRSFASTSGFRQLVAGGDPASVFVTGYTYDPRTWHVEYSLDAGDTWDDAAPGVDNDAALMAPVLVDPRYPRSMFAHAKNAAGEGDELWRFDAETAAADSILKLADGEGLVGVTLDGEALWVAGQRADAGSLYRADRDELQFERVTAAGPRFDCLGAHAGTLFACVNDFSYESKFVLAGSEDEGLTWQPLLTLEQLGQVETCGDRCAISLDWLKATYGAVARPDAGVVSNLGAEAPDGSAAAPTAALSASEAGGCAVSGTVGGTGSGTGRGTVGGTGRGIGWAPLVFVVALVVRRRGRPPRTVVRHRATAVLAACWLSAGCAGAEDGTDAAESRSSLEPGQLAADCGGRADQLADLEIVNRDVQLTLLELAPDPPAVGDNAWLVSLSDSEGRPVAGFEDSIVVTPFMPDHGHGTPVAVGVVEESAGRYRLSPVNTFMPGLWQIRLELPSDVADEPLQLSACVE